MTGSGLGLTIAKELSNLLDGDISLKSAPNQGSIFTVTIRAKTPLNESPETHIKSEDPLQPKDILLVENNINHQLNIFKMLAQTKNYYLDIAQSGVEAIDLLKAKNYDIILMDYKLPSLSGLETSKIIRDT